MISIKSNFFNNKIDINSLKLIRNELFKNCLVYLEFDYEQQIMKTRTDKQTERQRIQLQRPLLSTVDRRGERATIHLVTWFRGLLLSLTLRVNMKFWYPIISWMCIFNIYIYIYRVFFICIIFYCTILYRAVLYCNVGPLNPTIHGIRVASVIAFSVLCMFSVGLLDFF